MDVDITAETVRGQALGTWDMAAPGVTCHEAPVSVAGLTRDGELNVPLKTLAPGFYIPDPGNKVSGPFYIILMG